MAMTTILMDINITVMHLSLILVSPMIIPPRVVGGKDLAKQVTLDPNSMCSGCLQII